MKTYTLTDWLCLIGHIGHIVQCWWFRMDDPALTDVNKPEKSLNIFGKRNWSSRPWEDIKGLFFLLKRTWFGNDLQFKISSILSEEWKGNIYCISTRHVCFLPVILITTVREMLSVPTQHLSFPKLPKPDSCKRSMHTSIMKQIDRKWHKHKQRQSWHFQKWFPHYLPSFMSPH